MALLDFLHRKGKNLELVVAHLDHGMRPDSIEDRRLVELAANQYRLPFETKQAKLGSKTSEATARGVRYGFLRDVLKAHKAKAIITAHHQDDVLETAVINMLRGTGRKGLTALRDQKDILRPLLTVPKQELIDYAKDQDIRWREDATNNDTVYLRNYVRKKILPRFSEDNRDNLLALISDLRVTNEELDVLIAKQTGVGSPGRDLDRTWFNGLPHGVAREVLAGWLRSNELAGFDSKTLERLVVAAKTSGSGKKFPVIGATDMLVDSKHLALKRRER